MMTHEQRLDRLERIAKLMVRAGLRARREMRQQDDKITIMIDSQIKNEDRFAKLAASQNQHDEKIALLIDAQLRTDQKLAELAESQKNADRRLDTLIDIVQKGRNGKSRKE
jgi:D-serine deaminase-like pyridoxal phosphate-dependent protein